MLFGGYADEILNQVVTITAKKYLMPGDNLVLNLSRGIVPNDELELFIRQNTIQKIVRDTAPNVRAQYNIDWSTIRPLDEGIISTMRDCETVILKMMDRLERDYSTLLYEERKMQYLKHLRYWNHLLFETQTEMAVFFEIPHEVYDYVLYCLCKLYSIPTVVFHQTCMPMYSVMSDCWEQQSPELDEHYAKLVSDYRAKGLREDHSEYRNMLYNGYHQHFERRVPFYMGNKIGKTGVMKFLSKGPMHVAKFVMDHFRWLMKDRQGRYSLNRVSNVASFMIKNYRLKKCYRNLSSEPQKGEKFIYFALHAQPERSTSPQAGVFVDQLLAIQMLDYALPKGWRIYVKDHPVQTAVGRELSFYKELADILSVRIIDKGVDSHELVRNSVAVATCNGNVGLEAMLDDKPVITFGHVYYQCATPVFTVRNLEECLQCIEAIENGFTVDPYEVTLFFKALSDTSIHSSLDANFHRQTGLAPEEAVHEISRHLLRKIEQLKGQGGREIEYQARSAL